ncbi:DUF488 domain-containing protein [Cumulibacter manganitolerans]|uniref:DUF488 domain-containing protein n=1 Tax=Cumulibacter manganitolerans TaxID=1884992 RepID=UPI001E6239E2|nr:DUF488 domain-containing protein [Cumulibacter manganitolerans]
MAGRPTRVFTIGHSTRDLDEVLAMLQANDVTRLVDVRSYPSSRAFPQWNQDAIVASLGDRMGYEWIRELGGRRHTPAGVVSANDGWRVKAFRSYADYMATPEFHAGLRRLLQAAADDVPAIMCSEAVPWRCHRRLITDALLVRGVEVLDIMSETLTREAALTPFARVDGEEISYPKEDDRDDGRP